VREGGFRTGVFERYQRSEKALVASMQEMVVSGVSTRKVTDILEKMGGFEVSAATVSRTMVELDAQIAAFFSRPLEAAAFPYLIVDARYEKVRREGRVRSLAVLIVAGIREDGHRELLALETGDSESAQCWGEVFASLKQRGLHGVKVVVSDAHAGLRAALGRHLQGARWQRCRVHFMREMMAAVGSRKRKELAADLRAIYQSEDRARCLEVAGEIADKWQAAAPRMAAALRAGVESTLEVWDLPRNARRKLNSTNMIERLMRELKRRTRAIGPFPNEAACRRMVGAVLLETQDAWDAEPQRYLVPDDIAM
jgi:transposase-like protein